MLKGFFDRFWHKKLHRPYKLSKGINQGNGPIVVLLHGIGSSSDVWIPLKEQLQAQNIRLIAFDLLGFGMSSKPDWSEYTVDDHARSVIYSITALKNRNSPVVLVGHSMGALIAVRVARLRPDTVKHLILYEIPIYKGLPETKRYSLRKDLYFMLYEKIITRPPLSATRAGFKKSVKQLTGLNIDPETWNAFKGSLKNTIMNYDVLADMAKLKIPIEVIYGTLDVVVIKGKPKDVFIKVLAPIQTHKITHAHSISPRSSKMIAKRLSTILKLNK